MIYNKSKKNKMWDTKKLSDLGKFDRGVSKHRPRNDRKLFEGGGYPFIQTSDIKEANLYILKHTQEYGEFGLKQSKLWDAGTLCITIAANIADIAILSYPMCFPDSVVGFVADKKYCSEEFMYYIFLYINSAIKSIASGSTQDNINLEYLTTLEFKVPPKNYQDRIVKILKNIDDKINLNNKINDNLSNQLQTIYDYWFNQFEFPNEKGMPYKSSGGKFVYNDILKKEIPISFNVENLLINTISSIIKPGVDKFDKKIYYATADIIGTNIGTGNEISYVNRESRANMQPTLYSIWFAKMKNSIKHIFINNSIMNFANNIILSTGFLGLQCNQNSFEYLASFINSPTFEITKDSFAHGATQEAVNNDDISNIPLIVPDIKTLENYHSETNNLFEAFNNNIVENKSLLKLKNFLLPLLINGQATIS